MPGKGTIQRKKNQSCLEKIKEDITEEILDLRIQMKVQVEHTPSIEPAKNVKRPYTSFSLSQQIYIEWFKSMY